MPSSDEMVTDEGAEARVRWVAEAREKCRVLYEGVETPHRSCGIALAETFGRRTGAYQALRRGGVSGCGECGAIVGGRLVLGELLGDPSPTGQTTEALRSGIEDYERRWRSRVDRGAAVGGDVICNTLTAQFEAFHSEERHAFCTGLATEVATAVAEVLVARWVAPAITPIDDGPAAEGAGAPADADG